MNSYGRRITLTSPEASRRKPWSVYLVAGTLTDGRDVIKAGIATCPGTRLTQLAADGLAHPLLVIDLPNRRSADRLERAWMRAVAQHAHLRLERGTLSAKGDSETIVFDPGSEECVAAFIDAAAAEIERLCTAGSEVQMTSDLTDLGEGR